MRFKCNYERVVMRVLCYDALPSHVSYRNVSGCLLFSLCENVLILISCLYLYLCRLCVMLLQAQDPTREWGAPFHAATNLLQALARYRQKYTLPSLMPFMTGILTEYNAAPPQQRDYRKKDAVMAAMAYISKVTSVCMLYDTCTSLCLVAPTQPNPIRNHPRGSQSASAVSL
jgi:hypothetical protein